MNTNLLSNALKSVFGNGSVDNITSSSKVPYFDSNNNPSGLSTISNLASVLGVPGCIKAAVSSYTPNPNSDPVFEYNKNGVFCDVAFTPDKHILIRFNSSDTFQQII